MQLVEGNGARGDDGGRGAAAVGGGGDAALCVFVVMVGCVSFVFGGLGGDGGVYGMCMYTCA